MSRSQNRDAIRSKVEPQSTRYRAPIGGRRFGNRRLYHSGLAWRHRLAISGPGSQCHFYRYGLWRSLCHVVRGLGPGNGIRWDRGRRWHTLGLAAARLPCFWRWGHYPLRRPSLALPWACPSFGVDPIGRDVFTKRGFIFFWIIAAIIPHILGAIYGIGLLYLVGFVPKDLIVITFFGFWISNMFVVLIISPFLLKFLGPVVERQGMTSFGWWT